jgi:hypothetical protein
MAMGGLPMLKKVFCGKGSTNLGGKDFDYICVPTLASYMSTTCTFDLSMFARTHDIFIVVVNFLSSNWEHKHLTIGLFEAIATSGVTMVPKLWELLGMFSFTDKFLAYVKDEGLICNLVHQLLLLWCRVKLWAC